MDEYDAYMEERISKFVDEARNSAQTKAWISDYLYRYDGLPIPEGLKVARLLLSKLWKSAPGTTIEYITKKGPVLELRLQVGVYDRYIYDILSPERSA